MLTNPVSGDASGTHVVVRNSAAIDIVPLQGVYRHQSSAGQVAQGRQIARFNAGRIDIIGTIAQLSRGAGRIIAVGIGVRGWVAAGYARATVGGPPELVMLPFCIDLPVWFPGQGQPGNDLAFTVQFYDKAGRTIQFPCREIGIVNTGWIHLRRQTDGVGRQLCPV